MKILTFILYLACVIISGLIMTSIGYLPTTFQWWAVTFCVLFSYMIGQLSYKIR